MSDLDPWRELADAVCEHDLDHERRALAELAALTQRSGHAVEDDAPAH